MKSSGLIGVNLNSKTATVIESGLRVEQHIILTNPDELKQEMLVLILFSVNILHTVFSLR